MEFRTLKATEIWKSIPNFENYQVSNFGRIKNIKTDRILKLFKNRNGYYKTFLYNNKKRKCISIHRLVAEAFIPNIENKKEINHIDCNKQNNNVENLEWCTRQENHLHKCLNGLNNTKKAIEKNKKPILLIDEKGNVKRKYNSMMDACRELKLSVVNVSRVCSHQLNNTKGYIFRLESEEK